MKRKQPLVLDEMDAEIKKVEGYAKEMQKIVIKKKPMITQAHHCIYGSDEHPEQEVVVRVRKCEHRVLSLLSWYCKKTVSKGLVKAIKIWVAVNEDRAVEV